jgi:hypothetical protein
MAPERAAADAGWPGGFRRCAIAGDNALVTTTPTANTASQRNVARFGPKTPTPKTALTERG